jgi:hypothetical protein
MYSKAQEGAFVFGGGGPHTARARAQPPPPPRWGRAHSYCRNKYVLLEPSKGMRHELRTAPPNAGVDAAPAFGAAIGARRIRRLASGREDKVLRALCVGRFR